MKKSKWVKFKDLAKKDKIFRIINLVFSAALLLATIGMLIYYCLTGDKDNRLMSCIGMSLLYILPFAYELIFRRRLRNFFTFCYLLYSLFAGFVGCVLNVYHLTSWFDIVVHTLAGYVFSFFGIIILSRLENYRKLNTWTIIVFCLLLTLSVELVWELCEWMSDLVLNQTAQGEKVAGFNAPLVTDTDLDMLCNLVGGIIFSIHFAIGKLTKHDLGTKFFEGELLPEEKEETEEETKQEIEE